MDKVIIRTATRADIPDLIAIENSCFATDQISLRQMRYLLSQAKAATFVATTQHTMIGYAMVLLPKPPRSARLYSLAVVEHCRGQGIAQQLMTKLLAHVEQTHYPSIHLEVRASQAFVQHFYHSLGFVTNGRRANYYQDNEDAICMTKALSAQSY